MHINISTLHNVYILWQAQKYTDASLVLLNLPWATPWLFASTFPHPKPGLTHISSSGPGCQPLSHTRPLSHINPPLLKCMAEVCDTKRVPRYLPPTRVGRSFWKNYSDICMCHGYKAPGSYPPTSVGFPCQPAPRLYRPRLLTLRHSSLKLLNMANCVRREAHFIWIFWLGGDFPCIGEELSKDVWKREDLQLDTQVSVE